jgi:hypothetical protein
MRLQGMVDTLAVVWETAGVELNLGRILASPRCFCSPLSFPDYLYSNYSTRLHILLIPLFCTL